MRNFFNELTEILNILSSSSKEQISYLGSMSVDELGLEFDDIYHLINSKEDFKNLTGRQLNLLFDLNNKLDNMSRKESLWTKKALNENIEWMEIRNLANKIKYSLREYTE